MLSSPIAPLRDDLLVTTALKPSQTLKARARLLADELNADLVERRNDGLPGVFQANPTVSRILVVQTGRLLLVGRGGEELFYHPNMAFLRLGNLLRGGRDLLIEAAEIGRGDSVLDATLGYTSEAILCVPSGGLPAQTGGPQILGLRYPSCGMANLPVYC